MRVLVVGDFVLNNEKYNIRISDDVLAYIRKHDYKICNLEGPLRKPNSKQAIKAGSHVYNVKKSVDALLEMGINIVLLANNHIMDYGVESLLETIDILKDSKILTIGAGVNYDACYEPLALEDDIVLMNACQAEFGVVKSKWVKSGGYAWVNSDDFSEQIKKASNEGKKVIVLAHAGLECEETPLPEWQRVYHEFIKNGAYAVVASHPHIVQGMEAYCGRMIYYSLGNFFFWKEDKKDDIEWNRGMMVSFDTEKNEQTVKYVCVKEREIIFDETGLYQEVKKRSDILINEEALEKEANKIAEKCWRNYYKSYYKAASGGIYIKEMGIQAVFKKSIKHILGIDFENDLNEIFLLHNIQIETHRWVVERYLYNSLIDNSGKKISQ